MNCCVCYTKNYTTKTSCKHIICIQCLMNLKKFVCPMCRKDLFKEFPPNLQSYLKSKNNEEDVSILDIRCHFGSEDGLKKAQAVFKGFLEAARFKGWMCGIFPMIPQEDRPVPA